MLALSLGATLLAGPAAQAAVTPEGDVSPGTGDSYWSTGGSSSQAVAIGQSSPGSLMMNGGSTLASGQVTIGTDGAAGGEVELSDAGTSWAIANDAYIGFFGGALVEVMNGASVSTGSTALGYYAGSTGKIVVKGAGSQWSATSVVVGSSGNAQFNVTDSGKVTTSGNLDVQGGSGVGILNLGVSGNTTLVDVGGTFTNNGTVNVFALGNITGGIYLPVTATSFAGGGTLNFWGGSVAEGVGAFAVSDYTEYTTPLVGQNLSGARVNAGDGELIVVFADNAGTGNLEINEVASPLPSGYSYYEVVQIEMSGLTNSEIILSFELGAGVDEDNIYAWKLVGENWQEIDLEDTLGTYEQEYFNMMVDGGGVYALGVVPEPSTYAALIGACVLAFVCLRRRLRS
ncbi:PEP-CTERM sorting domain-containing protein [Ruficoccus amylovorans]|uniref:PEP-CTERM sorting domain-containing protein n=1 Tax=Ruficoccus amylovorans TaxID=1804625 RepID=A0A842HFQ0_9BACT|nr:PEP-CTERM sorting domain-containing protein [Ruficoccus amylovorans]MBC2595353.1 PEP-CTERM sorting domain-containing protein [Ruficoccus amylovorans]